MIRKRKLKTRWGLMLFLSIVVACIGFSVRYQESLFSFWHNIRRIFSKPDAEAIARSFKKESFGVYCAGAIQANDCFLFDEDGILFGAARTVVRDIIITIEDNSNFRPMVNKAFISEDEWRALKPIILSIQNKELIVHRITLNRAEKELTVIIPPTDIPVYFSLQFDPIKHLRALGQLTKKISFEKLQYFDLRVEGKIFYK